MSSARRRSVSGKIRKNTTCQHQHKMSQRSVDRLSLGVGVAYLQSGIQNSKASVSPYDGGPDEQCHAHVEGQYREKRKTKHQRCQYCMSQRSVHRLSLGLSAAYLQTGIQTSISPDSPHDDGPDEQCQAHVEGQCREKEEKTLLVSISTK